MHEPPQAASYDPKPPATRAPTMNDPGAFGLIGTDHDIVVARALAINATSASVPTRAGHASAFGWRGNQS